MKNKTLIFCSLVILFIGILSACSSTNDVTPNSSDNFNGFTYENKSNSSSIYNSVSETDSFANSGEKENSSLNKTSVSADDGDKTSLKQSELSESITGETTTEKYVSYPNDSYSETVSSTGAVTNTTTTTKPITDQDGWINSWY